MSARTQDLAVGSLSFRVENDTGAVRAIRFRGHEVLRGIYPAVRDTAWGTIPPKVARIEDRPANGNPSPGNGSESETKTLRFSAQVWSPAIALEWEATLEAHASGALRYRWRGSALRDFQTNRTGLCVLHPAEAAGAACIVEHVDGRTTASSFPVAISPHQPFRNVRAVTHTFAPDAEATVRCEGEVFEMEDQRNWTDASFKTYCRPLDWPAPYLLTAGVVVEHSVTLTLAVRNQPAAHIESFSSPARRPPGARAFRWPQIGFGLRAPLPPTLRERAHLLRPAHLRIETTPAALTSALAWARPEADALGSGCGLEVAILEATPQPPSRAAFPARCAVALFDDKGNTAAPAVIAAWQRAGFASVGTGTRNHFAELNRARPTRGSTHRFTTFGIDAQVHAFDDISLLETLSQHAVVARQAASIGGERPVAISPILLGPGRDSADPRLHSELGALWTLGSLARLADTGCVERATYFQLHGPDGILRESENENAPPSPLEKLFLILAHATRIERLEVGRAIPNAPRRWHPPTSQTRRIRENPPHGIYPQAPFTTPSGAIAPDTLDALVLHSGSGAPRHLLLAHYGETDLEFSVPSGLGIGGLGVVQLAPRSVQHFELPA